MQSLIWKFPINTSINVDAYNSDNYEPNIAPNPYIRLGIGLIKHMASIRLENRTRSKKAIKELTNTAGIPGTIDYRIRWGNRFKA